MTTLMLEGPRAQSLVLYLQFSSSLLALNPIYSPMTLKITSLTQVSRLNLRFYFQLPTWKSNSHLKDNSSQHWGPEFVPPSLFYPQLSPSHLIVTLSFQRSDPNQKFCQSYFTPFLLPTTSSLPKNHISSTFKRYLESNLFLPSLLLPPGSNH